MTLYLEKEIDVVFDFDYEKIARDVINAALDYVKFPYEIEISVTLTDESGIQSINKEFREIDSPTDVLSFPMVNYENAGDFSLIETMDDVFNPESGELILGDIVLCIPRIKAQAKEFGHSELREYAFLIAHSMMHLFGYDHMTPSDATIMEQKQEVILEMLKITRD